MNQSTALAKLRKESVIAVAVAVAMLAVSSLAVKSSFSDGDAFKFLVIVGAFLSYQGVHLFRHLNANTPLQGGSGLYDKLGAANWITLVRAFLLAHLAGFVFLPAPAGWAVWAPGVIYMAAAVLDFVDGAVARLSGQASRLGEILDMHWDGFGVLAASVILVQSGQVPVWYLLVGLARYLYVFGLWLRRRRGLPVYDLPPSAFRRPLAGLQMGFIAVVLLPVFSPPVTHVAAVFFAGPLLIGFFRDWLFVSGVVTGWHIPSGLRAWLARWVGVGMRILLVAVLSWLLLAPPSGVNSGAQAVMFLALSGLILGIAGRLIALVVMILAGFSLAFSAADWRLWAAITLSAGVLLFGTGKFSLWKPEEWLIYHRIGDPKTPR